MNGRIIIGAIVGIAVIVGIVIALVVGGGDDDDDDAASGDYFRSVAIEGDPLAPIPARMRPTRLWATAPIVSGFDYAGNPSRSTRPRTVRRWSSSSPTGARTATPRSRNSTSGETPATCRRVSNVVGVSTASTRPGELPTG